ncbi:MAG: EAL domain-containing protein [Gammaproteobacteria bacterium]|nr:EAL domain-containing protein [Gammaproteobacteria bacterium]
MAWIALTGWLLLAAVLLLTIKWRWQLLHRARRFANEIDHISSQKIVGGQVTVSAGKGALQLVEQATNRLFHTIHNRRRSDQQREQIFRRLAENVQETIVVHRDVILYANPQAAAMRGARQTDLIGRPFTDMVHPDDQARVMKLVRNVWEGKDVQARIEIKLITRHGDSFWVEATVKRIPYEGKPALMFSGYNITRRKLAEHALVEEKDRAQTTLAAISDAVITTDIKGRIDYVNELAETLLGCKSRDACEQKFEDLVQLVDDIDRKNIEDPVTKALQSEQRVSIGRRALLICDGKERPVEMTVSPIAAKTGGILGAVVVMRDVTEVRGLAKQMSYQASHDTLTGLLNRSEFERQVEEAIASPPSQSHHHVLCYLDLDRFKAVNDTCGHMAGDNMLREVAQLIKDQVRESDAVARLGGDEFGLILHGCPLDKATQIAEDVCHAIEEYRFVWRDQIFNFGVSIGLVEISSDMRRVDDAIAAADAACYMAKQAGRGGVHVYSAQDEARARNRGEIAWLQRLQWAVDNEQFELYSQPIMSTKFNGQSRAVSPSCEVLLRMHSQDGRRVLPQKFLPTAERYQLMPTIDRWVVRTAFAALSQGNLKVPSRSGCAINISGQTLGDPQFLDYVVENLDAYGLSPSQVCFEVSEPSVMRNLTEAHRFIEVLHGIGCNFGLDDFGSGSGALNHLKSLAMDYIKLDGPMVANFNEPVNKAIVHAMVELARTLNVQVIAEQVENRDMLAQLRQIGVRHFQGYAIAYPMPIYQQDVQKIA